MRHTSRVRRRSYSRTRCPPIWQAWPRSLRCSRRPAGRCSDGRSATTSRSLWVNSRGVARSGASQTSSAGRRNDCLFLARAGRQKTRRIRNGGPRFDLRDCGREAVVAVDLRRGRHGDSGRPRHSVCRLGERPRRRQAQRARADDSVARASVNVGAVSCGKPVPVTVGVSIGARVVVACHGGRLVRMDPSTGRLLTGPVPIAPAGR